MAQLDTARYGIPDPFPYQEARILFKGVLPICHLDTLAFAMLMLYAISLFKAASLRTDSIRTPVVHIPLLLLQVTQ